MAFAGQITVAVANEFDFTLDELRQAFESVSGHTLSIVPGPSNQLFGRIMDGAAYDIFLSDDMQRPQALDASGQGVPGTRFTYASSRLVLWGISSRTLNEALLKNMAYQSLAITNPRLSHYGEAAREVLQHLEIWDAIQDKLVLGDNIGQTYQFGIGGDVELALISFSQIIYGRYLQAGSYWLVPDDYYSPLLMQGVQLTNNPAAADFVAFMRSDDGQAIIRSNGYNTP